MESKENVDAIWTTDMCQLPKKIYITKDASSDEMTSKILLRLKQACDRTCHKNSDLEVLYVDNSSFEKSGSEQNAHKEDADKKHSNSLNTNSLSGYLDAGISTISRAKRSLLLAHKKASWIRPCPGTTGHVCCNLWTIDAGEGCPLDCTYCYLQNYLAKSLTNKIFTNAEELISEIETKVKSEPNRFFRICTGEVMDSLVWDGLTDLSCLLVPLFSRLPNALLELKTKTKQIDNILSLGPEHSRGTVISWSVNAPQICETDEAYTASLGERIEAARRVSELGYRVGFHFDPIVYFDEWKNAYRDTIRHIFSKISPKNIAWISLSSLRYPQKMQSIMRKRFPSSRLAIGEQFLATDRKLRYIQPLRFMMLSFMWEELKKFEPKLPVYMCMESTSAWRVVARDKPAAYKELSEVFCRNCCNNERSI